MGMLSHARARRPGFRGLVNKDLVLNRCPRTYDRSLYVESQYHAGKSRNASMAKTAAWPIRHLRNRRIIF